MKANPLGINQLSYNLMSGNNKLVDGVEFLDLLRTKGGGRLSEHQSGWSTSALLIHRFAVPRTRLRVAPLEKAKITPI